MEFSFFKSEKAKLLLLALCIAAAVFGVYSKVLNYGLTNLDDADCIHTCADAMASKTALIDAFKTNVLLNAKGTPYYRPMVAVSFIIDSKIAGQSYAFAHFTCILLHCIASILVFFFLRKYLRFKDLTAFLAAMLFALHPAAMYVAVWITGRNESLFFITFIISFALFIEYMDKKKISLLAGHIFFMFLCFFSKESGIILPFVFFLYYFLNKEKGRKLGIPVYALWAVFVLIFMQMRKAAVNAGGFGLNLSLDNIGMFFDYYSSLIFLRTPFNADSTIAVFITGSIAAALTIFFAFYKKTDQKEIKRNLFYLLLPLLILGPTLSASDRLWFQGNRMYTPLFAVVILFFSFMSAYLENKKTKKIAVAFISALLIFSSAIVWKRSEVYKNGMNFWGEIVKTNKHFELTAQKFYIYALTEQGKFQDAVNHAVKVSQTIGLSEPETIYAGAYAMYMNGNFSEAAKAYEFLIANKLMEIPQVYAGAVLANGFSGNSQKADMYFTKMCETFKAPHAETGSYINNFKLYMDGKKAEALKKAAENKN
jgi:hypothetical protein